MGGFRDLLDSPHGDAIVFTPIDITTAINSLKRDKAPGPDGIESEHLCFSGPLVQQVLCDIFNAMLASCHIPEVFTLGFVTAIPKGADFRIPPIIEGSHSYRTSQNCSRNCSWPE